MWSTSNFSSVHVRLTLQLTGLCTAIRSSHGIQLDNERLLNSRLFLCYLPYLDGIDKARANRLLFPDDPQDVPCAIKLIHAII